MEPYVPYVYAKETKSDDVVTGFEIFYTLKLKKNDFISKIMAIEPLPGKKARALVINVKNKAGKTGLPTTGKKTFYFKNAADPQKPFEIPIDSREECVEVRVVLRGGGHENKGKSTVAYDDMD